MGAEFSGTIRSELKTAKKVVGYNPEQVRLLREKFNFQCEDDLSLTKKGLAAIMRIKDEEAEEIFRLFDIDGSKTIESYELLTSVALLGYSPLLVVEINQGKGRNDFQTV
jgi:Ca2+-binding EF-hand superfamily protein